MNLLPANSSSLISTFSSLHSVSHTHKHTLFLSFLCSVLFSFEWETPNYTFLLFFLGGGGGVWLAFPSAAANSLASMFCRAQLIPTQADRPTRMCPWRRRRRAAGRRGSSRPPSSWRGQRSLSLAAIYEQSTPTFYRKLPRRGQTAVISM